jgi:hypothetical protein
MRVRTIAAAAVVAALGGGMAVFVPALPASAKNAPNLQNLSNEINKAKKATYYAQYKDVTNGQTSTVTIAQQPPKSLFSTGDGNSIISTGTSTYECYPNSGNSGSTGSTGSTGNTGNSGNTGTSTTTTTTTKPPSELCGVSKGSNPLIGAESAFSPAAVTGAFAQAEQSAVAKALGIKISYSTGKFGGLSATCVSVTRKGQTVKYCVAPQGILAYSSTGKNNYFELEKYTNHPPASAFQPPPGAKVEKSIP